MRLLAVGDMVVAETERVARPPRPGVIEEVLPSELPRYRVRWADGHTSIIAPSAGALCILPVGGRPAVGPPGPVRAVNDGIRMFERPHGGLFGFLCECGDPQCTAILHMTALEYDLAARVDGRLPVAPGHERPRSDYVLDRSDRFVLVERPGAPTTYI